MTLACRTMLAASFTLALLGCQESAQSPVERGGALVKAMGCEDCHTPWTMGPQGPHPDPERHLSGHPAALEMPPAPLPAGPWMISVAATNTAWSGPWGTSFTANLTPDPETGLGKWSEDMFIATVRSGRHMGQGRAILPPMPLHAIGSLDDDDLKAIFAYLQSLPPIENAVPQPRPPQAGV